MFGIRLSQAFRTPNGFQPNLRASQSPLKPDGAHLPRDLEALACICNSCCSNNIWPRGSYTRCFAGNLISSLLCAWVVLGNGVGS